MKGQGFMKSNDQIKFKFVDQTKEIFDIPHSDYVTHNIPKYNCVQVWKRGWSTSKEVATYKGIHYEIQFFKNLDNLDDKDVRVNICLHNESSKNRIPNKVVPRTRDLFTGKFDFDTEENAQNSINEIVTQLKQVADSTEAEISKNIKKYQEQL